MIKDALGDRMKAYEDQYRMLLPKKSFYIARIDGRAFHTYVDKYGFDRPFDCGLQTAFEITTVKLCKEIQGTLLGYTQSDEISIVFTDTTSENAQPYFGGNIQKIASVVSSVATQTFNEVIGPNKPASFDARIFHVPNTTEAANNILWRIKDCERNSISSYARSFFSHKELFDKNKLEQIDMICNKGYNWEELSHRAKYGFLVKRGIRSFTEIEEFKPNFETIFGIINKALEKETNATSTHNI